MSRGHLNPVHLFLSIKPQAVPRATLGQLGNGDAVSLLPTEGVSGRATLRTNLHHGVGFANPSGEMLEHLEGESVGNPRKHQG